MPYREALDLIQVTAWDILTVEEYFSRKCKRPYKERLDELKSVVIGFKTLSIVETREVTTLGEVMQHFEEVIHRDGEGVVVKSMDGVWVDSKPSYQIKVKKEINLDLKIVAFNYGTGKNANLISSVDVESSDGLLKTSPTGISESDMEYITEHQEELLNTIMEIKCSGLSQDKNGNYSVMHPVYKLLRNDKVIANSLAECIEIDKSTML
jgi:ATP-dependent DNA ligase